MKLDETYHEDVKLIQAAERSFHGLPERHDEADSRVGTLTTRKRFCVFGRLREP